jgi:hypothetical protein
VNIRTEIATLATSLSEISVRITGLVESSDEITPDVYTDLVEVERTVGTLQRQLVRLSQKPNL